MAGENTLVDTGFTFTPKYTLMMNISLGFVGLWIIVGIVLAWYVYSQTKDADLKTNFAL